MKHYIIILIAAMLSVNTIMAQFSINGAITPPYDYKSEANTTLDHVYVVNSVSGITLTYTETQNRSVTFYKYNQSTTTPIPNSDIDVSSFGGTTTYTIRNIDGDHGYRAEYGGASAGASVWIVDYSLHGEDFSSLNINDQATDKCSFVRFVLDKNSAPITFIDQNGSQEVKRHYSISYQNKIWDNTLQEYREETLTEELIPSSLSVKAPLMDTEFTLSKDQFARHFGIAASISTPYEALRVEQHATRVIVSTGGSSTESATETEDLFNAPTEMDFFSNASPATQHYSWKIYHNADKSDPDAYLVRYNDRDISYTFTAKGKYDVILEIRNDDSSCTDNVFETSFTISDSYLEFPNFLSPGTSKDGRINTFRASYKSLLRFKCTIFNRWGNKIYEWSDPAGSWDGTYKGKTVSPGVYFYVVDAEGSDGIKYKRGGDINVLHGDNNNSISTQ